VVPYPVGAEVLLSTKKISLVTPGPPKLWPKYIGPFRVLQRIGKVAYKLELPANMGIHPVFHVSLLRKFVPGKQALPPPLPEAIGSEYVIEKILDFRIRKVGRGQRKEYLIKWEDYGPEHNTWEPATVIRESAPIVIAQFEKRQKSLSAVGGATKGVKRKPSQPASQEQESWRLLRRFTNK
jgi:hypothetical protein